MCQSAATSTVLQLVFDVAEIIVVAVVVAAKGVVAVVAGPLTCAGDQRALFFSTWVAWRTRGDV